MFCHNISITQHFQYHIFNRTEACFLDVTLYVIVLVKDLIHVIVPNFKMAHLKGKK